ncbi:hypothetical protein CXB51_030895 [Gossypium anomalum]|uniref:Expansin n=1 Tax=Gossypium anomalum TaxID=47600 RepID=A0A8J6CRS6_9ROSI|nr:hypothetical protein CXB51_030895 [Gossypium anomalum]
MDSAYLFTSAVLIVGLYFSPKFHVADAAHTWLSAHATFYGGSDASGTMGGACGYGNLYTDGYGTNTAALSTALFNDGKACGGCYQITCDARQVPQWCLKGKYITITATTSALPTMHSRVIMGVGVIHPDNTSTSKYRAGIVPVLYRRVTCRRKGGMRFTINGRNYFELVLISNGMDKGIQTNKWESMSRNWGANWQSLSYLNGQSLSFRIQASNGRIRYALNVVPSNWQFGQSFKTNAQI